MASWEEVPVQIKLDALRSLFARDVWGLAVQGKKTGGGGEEGGQRTLGKERSEG